MTKNERQIIHLYAICWNEEKILNYFFKHYDSLVEVDKYIFFDDGSTHSTLEILKNHPKVEVRSMPRLEVASFVLAQKEISNSCWKESRGKADWVIIVDLDEFIYVPYIRDYLLSKTKEGVTAIPALGYEMLAEEFPSEDKNLVELVKRGFRYPHMNKLTFFDPNIEESNYHVGRHFADLAGTVVFPAKDELLLLHYKYLGYATTYERQANLEGRMGSLDRENGWGIQYRLTKEEYERKWNEQYKNSVENILAYDYFPSLHSPIEERWWRNDFGNKQKKNSIKIRVKNIFRKVISKY